MSAQSTTSTASTSITGLLGVAFIVLKLCGVIAWSWWWVLAPFWIPVATALVAIALVGVLVLISAAGGKSVSRPRRRHE